MYRLNYKIDDSAWQHKAFKTREKQEDYLEDLKRHYGHNLQYSRVGIANILYSINPFNLFK